MKGGIWDHWLEALFILVALAAALAMAGHHIVRAIDALKGGLP